MTALGRDDERLDPSTRVFTVLARISERGCQTLFIRSITTKIEMTCKSWTEQKNKSFIFAPHRWRFHFNNQRLVAEKVSVVLYVPFDNWVLFILFHSFVERCQCLWCFTVSSPDLLLLLLLFFVFFIKQSLHSFEVELLRWIFFNNNKAAKFL